MAGVTAGPQGPYLNVAFLAVLGVWAAVIGDRAPGIWFRLCPVVMRVAAGLPVAAARV